MNGLNKLNEVLLIYSNTKVSNDKENNSKVKIIYNVICDIDNIVGNMDVLKKIVARLEVLKREYNINNIDFDYVIKTKNKLEQEIAEKNNKTIKNLQKATIVYYKNNTYKEIVNKTR